MKRVLIVLLGLLLGACVGGIRNGVYPANPGKESWRPATGQTWENCQYCPFDRVCPSTRAEQWNQQRTDSAAQPYAALADPEAPRP